MRRRAEVGVASDVIMNSSFAHRKPRTLEGPIHQLERWKPDGPARPIRTAIVLPSGCRFSAATPNSMETVVRTLASASGADEVRIFCCEGAEDRDRLDVETLPTRRRRHTLVTRLRAYQPHLIEYHQQVKQAVAVAEAIPNAAHVLYRHNALKAPRHWMDDRRYNARYARVDGIVFVSSAERAFFAKTYPRLADRAWAVPNPIDAAPWLAPIDNREPVIAFAGRAMPEKGVDIICAALPAILDKHPDWKVVLMLNDWTEHQRWAAPHIMPLDRYGARVTILRSAPIEEVRQRLKSASIALTPSVWDEPFGLTAIEAHAAGAALISSGRGGLREASGPHALYLDDLTPRALTAAIRRLILHPAERLAMARAAQRYVLDVHTPERRAAELMNIRRAVISNRDRSRAFARH